MMMMITLLDIYIPFQRTKTLLHITIHPIHPIMSSFVGKDTSPKVKEDWTKSIKKTEIIFFRHAESFNNVIYETLRKIHGDDVSEEVLVIEEQKLRQADSELSERGLVQVQNLEKYVGGGGLSSFMDDGSWGVVCSPMQRCLLTCKAVSNGLGKSVVVNPRLYEAGGCYSCSEGEKHGHFGATSEDIEGRFPGFKCLPGMEEGWYKSSTMETGKEFRERVTEIVDWLWDFHEREEARQLTTDAAPCENLIVVVHANLINGIICGLLRGNGLYMHNNTGFTHVQLLTAKGKRVAVIKSMNNVPHLTDDGLWSGNNAIDDHFIQEFMEDEDYFLPL